MDKYAPLNRSDDDEEYVRVLRKDLRVHLNARIPADLKKELEGLAFATGGRGMMQENVTELLTLALSAHYRLRGSDQSASVEETRRRLERVLAEL